MQLITDKTVECRTERKREEEKEIKPDSLLAKQNALVNKESNIHGDYTYKLSVKLTFYTALEKCQSLF